MSGASNHVQLAIEYSATMTVAGMVELWNRISRHCVCFKVIHKNMCLCLWLPIICQKATDQENSIVFLARDRHAKVNGQIELMKNLR